MNAVSKSLARQMTGIEWADFTANYWIGCTRLKAVSGAMSGCDICYAATFAENRMGVTWGAGADRRKSVSIASRLRHMNKVAEKTGKSFSVFSLSLGDWLDPEVDDATRSEFLALVEECSSLTFLLLTHRPHLAANLLPYGWVNNLPKNVWPGVTIDHELHGFRWEQLLKHWGNTRRVWISAEPLSSSLQALDLSDAASIIIGGASNTIDPAWAFKTEWAIEAIERYGQKVFFKQYGVFRDGAFVGDKKVAGRDIEGQIFDKTPWPRHRDELAAIAA